MSIFKNLPKHNKDAKNNKNTYETMGISEPTDKQTD